MGLYFFAHIARALPNEGFAFFGGKTFFFGAGLADSDSDSDSDSLDADAASGEADSDSEDSTTSSDEAEDDSSSAEGFFKNPRIFFAMAR